MILFRVHLLFIVTASISSFIPIANGANPKPLNGVGQVAVVIDGSQFVIHRHPELENVGLRRHGTLLEDIDANEDGTETCKQKLIQIGERIPSFAGLASNCVGFTYSAFLLYSIEDKRNESLLNYLALMLTMAGSALEVVISFQPIKNPTFERPDPRPFSYATLTSFASFGLSNLNFFRSVVPQSIHLANRTGIAAGIGIVGTWFRKRGQDLQEVKLRRNPSLLY